MCCEALLECALCLSMGGFVANNERRIEERRGRGCLLTFMWHFLMTVSTQSLSGYIFFLPVVFEWIAFFQLDCRGSSLSHSHTCFSVSMCLVE